mmetsp:Transcript_22043/g.66216  ORF Transcript_22043/g.66216 Transcript_22043/m.66216 type:complete len:219 (-) Transcript_22043:216-872(-)
MASVRPRGRHVAPLRRAPEPRARLKLLQQGGPLQKRDLGVLPHASHKAVGGAGGRGVLAELVQTQAGVANRGGVALEARALALGILAHLLAHLLAIHPERRQLRLQECPVVLVLREAGTSRGGTAAQRLRTGDPAAQSQGRTQALEQGTPLQQGGLRLLLHARHEAVCGTRCGGVLAVLVQTHAHVAFRGNAALKTWALAVGILAHALAHLLTLHAKD